MAAYEDFRNMIETEKLDGVMIETTTHARAWITILAMQAGMDVYIEKPMALTIAEGRAMVNAARKLKPRHPGRHPAAVDTPEQLGQRPGQERRDRQNTHRGGPKLREPDPLEVDLYQRCQGTGGAVVGRVDQPGRIAS